MIERLKVSIFRPRLIGKFLTDKIYVVLFYFLFLITLVSIPKIIQLINVDTINISENTDLIYSFESSPQSEIYFSNKKMIGQTEEVYYGKGIIVSFNKVIKSSNEIVFVFDTDKVSIYYLGYAFENKDYSTINFNDFGVIDIQNKDIVGLDGLFIILNAVYDDFNTTIMPVSIIMILIRSVGLYLFVVALLFFLTSSTNIKVNSFPFRFKICVYSITVLAFLEFFSVFLGIDELFYLGLVLAYFAADKALKSIVRIEIRKR